MRCAFGGALALALAVVAPARARADDGPATPLGWTAGGALVARSGKPLALRACTPATVRDPAGGGDDIMRPADYACVPCDGGDDCHVVTPIAAPIHATARATIASPDGNAVLSAGRGCHAGHAGERACNSWVTFDRLGTLTYVGRASSAAQPPLDIWFRPDARAVLVRFPDTFWVVDLSPAVAPRASAVTEARALVGAQLATLRALDGAAPAASLATRDALFYVDEAARGAVTPTGLRRVLDLSADTRVDHVHVTRSENGNAAWIELDAGAWHAAELAVRTDAGWRLASGLWSHSAAPAPHAHPLRPAQVAATRQDLPVALSVTGAMLRDGDPAFVTGIDATRLPPAPWRARFAAGVRGDRVHGALSPDATSGWIVANLELATRQPDGAVAWAPYRAWIALDSAGDGAAAGSLDVVFAQLAPLR